MDKVLLKKYLAEGETWPTLCERVASIMPYQQERNIVQHALQSLQFLPNSPTLVNAAKAGGRNLMACHLLHVPDSIDGIFDAVKQAAVIFKSGGGLGLEFSAISPSGTPLKYAPGGLASGPVSFMRIFDTTAQVVMEGGLRRAAIMGNLNVKHPDIQRFITVKADDGILQNFNISVTVDNGPDSVEPQLWKKIITYAHRNGEPGVLFLDNINNSNPTLVDFGPILGANACVTGDTMVAVADGRDAVSIRTLAEEGKDVPVYCQGPNGITIRYGRHPRKTRSQVPIMRVIFDNDTEIKATSDHSLMLQNGKYRQVQDLRVDDNLMSFNKYKYQNHSQFYWIIHANQVKNRVVWFPEYQLVNEFLRGKKLQSSGGIFDFCDNNVFYSHKVVAVEPCGTEDVYNITVDDFHNLAYVTEANGKTLTGNVYLSGVISKNCSEIPLYHAGSCVLASINLCRTIPNLGDFSRFKDVVKLVVKFLNRVIEVNHYPLAEIAQATRRTRNIGVGVMGWADLLREHGIPYTSQDALDIARELATTLYTAADLASWDLAQQDGGYLPDRRRNATVTCIAPTGHISRLAGVSPAIYPDYAEALQMSPEDHLNMVEAWQKGIDNAISYTVCFAEDQPVDFVDAVYRGAHDRGLKCMSVYRDNSRKGQPCKVDGTCSL